MRLKPPQSVCSMRNFPIVCWCVFLIVCPLSLCRATYMHRDVATQDPGHTIRNLALIQKLSNSVRFDVQGGTKPFNKTVQMTNHLGQQYVCKIGNKTRPNTEVPEGSPGASISTMHGGISSSSRAGFNLQDPARQVQRLKDVCIEFPLGWWTYRWCHEKQVTQFHKEKDGTVDKAISLGIYAPKKTVIEGAVSVMGTDGAGKKMVGALGSKFVFHFVKGNGEGCTEGNMKEEGRSTTISLTCCKEAKVAAASQEIIRSGVVVALNSFNEVSQCTYKFELCTPLLCEPDAPTPAQAASTVHRLLKPLENVCMQKHEGGWSYEFCYRHHIRQVHLEAVAEESGKRVTKVASEYVLGKFGSLGPREAKMDEKEDPGSIVPSVENPEAKSFVQEYIDGDECGVTGGKQKRSTRAHFICLPGSKVNYIVSIKEDRTCHYTIVVNTPYLCNHGEFKIKNKVDHELVCTPRGVDAHGKDHSVTLEE